MNKQALKQLEANDFTCEYCLTDICTEPVRPYLKEGRKGNRPSDYFTSCTTCVELLEWIYKQES